MFLLSKMSEICVLGIKFAYFPFKVPNITLSEFDFHQKIGPLIPKRPQKFQKSDLMNIKMVKIDPKSFEIKSLKISAFQVLYNTTKVIQI